MDRRLALPLLALGLLVSSGHAAYQPAQVLVDYVNVRDYLPPGQPDGVSDNSVGFRAVATAMCARSSNGARIRIPAPPNAAQYKAHDISQNCGNIWYGDGAAGVGSANGSGGAASVTRGGTSISYTSASSNFMKWAPSNFPAFASGAHINGGGIYDVALFDGLTTTTALVNEGTQDWKAANVVLNGAYRGVFMKGVEFPVTSHISMYGTRNANYTIIGDLTGQTSAGAACSASVADCSTRNDGWFGDYLTNIDNTGTNTVVTITGFVDTPTLSHVLGEGPQIGMNISCPTGLNGAMAQCPQFGRFDDLQFENFTSFGVKASDFLNVYFDHLYAVGGSPNFGTNSVFATSTNYTTSATPVGRLKIESSQLFATSSDCVELAGTMWDVEIIDTDIYGCNISNGNRSAIDSSGTLTDLKVLHNTVGEIDGYGGQFPLARAVSLSAGTTNAQIANNLWNPSGGVGYATFASSTYTQVSPVLNSSSSPWTIHDSGNMGPGGQPTVSGCGTSPSILSGSDNSIRVQTGTGSEATCTVTFGSIKSSAPHCNANAETGASNNVTVTTSNATVTLANFSTGGVYQVQCSVN